MLFRVFLLLALFLVCSPTLAYGADSPPDVSDPVAVWAFLSGKLGAPIAFGYALRYLVELLRRVPKIGELLFERVLVTDLSRRIFVAALAVAPGVALILTEHMAWDRALLTALMTYAVSQWDFLSAKLAEKNGTPSPSVPPLPVLMLLLVGCGIDKAKLEAGLNGGAAALTIAKPCLSDMQGAEEAQCKGDAACIEDVMDRWDIVGTGYDAFGCLLCTVDETAEGCATEKPCEALAAKVAEVSR